MAIGRAQRRSEREGRFIEAFGASQAPTAQDLFELIELAWHDCYGEAAPPEAVIEDMITVSRGQIEGLVRAGRLGVTDWRDLSVLAEDLRNGTHEE